MKTVKERPILFSGAMVRALLDGSKTQTRRIVKPQPGDEWAPVVGAYHPTVTSKAGEESPGAEIFGASDEQGGCKCPYGQPGDRLWVRETHRPIFGQTCGLIAVDYRADPRERWERLGDSPDSLVKPTKWVPSIHMRREYSRIVREIVSVRVERLNDCSALDAIAEGILRVDNNFGNGPAYCDYRAKNQDDTAEWFNSPIDSYRTLWESINGAGSWAVNPWVWVIELRKATP